VHRETLCWYLWVNLSLSHGGLQTRWRWRRWRRQWRPGGGEHWGHKSGRYWTVLAIGCSDNSAVSPSQLTPCRRRPRDPYTLGTDALGAEGKGKTRSKWVSTMWCGLCDMNFVMSTLWCELCIMDYVMWNLYYGLCDVNDIIIVMWIMWTLWYSVFIVMYYMLKCGDILSYVIISPVVVNKTREALTNFFGEMEKTWQCNRNIMNLKHYGSETFWI
jgi:hypothetical protein